MFNMIGALLVSLFLSSAYAGGMEISQKINKTEVAFEDSVLFEIQLQWEGPQTMYRFSRPLNPYIDRFKLGGVSTSISSQIVDGKEVTKKLYKYILIPTSAGNGLIDSVVVPYMYYKDTIPLTMLTEPMSVSIANPLPKVKKTESISYWLIILGVMVLGGAIFLIVRLKMKKPTEPVLTPKEKLLQELAEVKKSAGTDLKKFQTGFYQILTKFISSKYNISVSLIDMEVLAEKLTAAGMNQAHAEQCKKWLEKADKDKFSPDGATPGEVIRLESDIRAYIEKM